MKCSFCGKELEAGAEFCPECGMILSLGGVTEGSEVTADEQSEVPEYTPNVFKAMDIEEEPVVPAMELEVSDVEETAVVVEAIPEYVPDEEEQEPVLQEEEIFVAPEYDPNAEVSAQFTQQASYETQYEEEEFTAFEEPSENEEAYEEVYQEAYEEPIQQEAYTENEADEFAPPEYDTGAFVVSLPESEEVYAEDVYSASQEAYPVYDTQSNESVPEERPTEDESLFAALFESDDAERIEDITPVDGKPEKTSKKSVVSIVLLIVVLIGVVAAGGYVFKNVLPKIVDTSNTTTAATDEQVDGTVKPEDKTTTEKADKTTTEKADKTTTEKADKTTTEKNDTDKTTSEKETTEADSTTEEPTTEEPTTETTTKAPETTTEPVTEEAEPVVVEPSSYNVDEVPFFPIIGDISIKAGPSAGSADMIMHPYGYPVYAYAKEGSYYYVHSPILDYMGWVNEKDLEEYVEPTTAAPVTDAPQPEEAPAGDKEVSYTAVIKSDEGLNFRTGPGSDYEIKYTVPGGYKVRVIKESSENPGWVYVTIEDERYPYGSPNGWVASQFLS